MFQYGDPSHPIMGKFFDAEKVISDTNVILMKKVFHCKDLARKFADRAHKNQIEIEYHKYDTAIKSKPIICALEREAKNAIRHQYRFTYECTYKDTHECP
jgi:hypothetical protein